MPFRFAAAALAALVLATPAAAQDNAVDVMSRAMQRLVANTEGVRDYTLTLRSGILETEVYVYRDGDEWEVAGPEDDEQAGGVLKALVVWPGFSDLDAEFPDPGEVSDEDLEEFGDAFTLTRETLDGRQAQVLFVRLRELMEVMEDGEPDSGMPDSLRLFLDPESHQILRVHVAGDAPSMGELGPGGGSMEATMDFGDYRETDGLTVPHTMRMTMDVDVELTAEQRAGMRAGIEYARSQMAADDSEEARQGAALIDLMLPLLTEGHLEVPVSVENVRVNAGPPSWFEG